MNFPAAVNTTAPPAAAGKQLDSPTKVDSAFTAAGTPGSCSKREPDEEEENERRLADYVSKMEELRKTTGEEGFKIQQGIKVQKIISGLLTDSEKVLADIT